MRGRAEVVKYCPRCKTMVTTHIIFDRTNMAYIECDDCYNKIYDNDDCDDDADDYEELSFMNDFGDSD